MVSELFDSRRWREVPGFDLGVDLDVDHGGPLDHVARVRIGLLERLVDRSVGVGQSTEGAPVIVVREQDLVEPRSDRIPVLHQHRDRHELALIASLAALAPLLHPGLRARLLRRRQNGAGASAVQPPLPLERERSP